MPFLPTTCSSTVAPCCSSSASRARASRSRLVLKPPQSPRLAVRTTKATRLTCVGRRNKGKRSASSGVYTCDNSSPSASAYGRADATRSAARFILEVATISIVRVILRVFSTDLMRPLSSRPFAIYRLLAYCSMPRFSSASMSFESALVVRTVSATCGNCARMNSRKPFSHARILLVSMVSRRPFVTA